MFINALGHASLTCASVCVHVDAVLIQHGDISSSTVNQCIAKYLKMAPHRHGGWQGVSFGREYVDQ